MKVSFFLLAMTCSEIFHFLCFRVYNTHKAVIFLPSKRRAPFVPARHLSSTVPMAPMYANWPDLSNVEMLSYLQLPDNMTNEKAEILDHKDGMFHIHAIFLRKNESALHLLHELTNANYKVIEYYCS